MAAALHCASTEGQSLPLEDIQARLINLADKERLLPLDQEVLIDDARFAVYAWVDEKLLHAERPDALGWVPLSLQCHYYSTTEAGRLFFTRLNALLDQLGIAKEEEDLGQRLELALNLTKESRPYEVLQIFALCLLYGFSGKLYNKKELLARLRKTSLLLLKQNSTLIEQTITPQVQIKQSNFQIFEPVLYVMVPIVISIIFWFYCADILAYIPLKEF